MTSSLKHRGVRPLYIAHCRGGDRLTSEFGSDPQHSNGRHAGLHSHCLAPGHGPLIRRLIWSELLYWLGDVASRTCFFAAAVSLPLQRGGAGWCSA